MVFNVNRTEGVVFMEINNNSQSTIINQNPAFRGKWAKSENGTPYYKTNSGTVAGSIMAVPALAFWLTQKKDASALLDLYEKMGKKLEGKEKEAIINNAKRIAKNKYIFGAIAAVCTAACGIIYDNVRNKKAKEIAESVRQLGTKGTIENNSNAAFSRRGNVYYEASDGLKLGGLMGACCGLIEGAINAPKKPAQWLSSIIILGLGGMLMGKIADSNSNKDTRKNV